MRVVGVIPARYASTRLPGKPLVKILGKPMLQWVVEGALQCKGIDKVIVATDHADIFGLAQSLKVGAKMTDPDLPSGSDRVWAAVQDEDADVVLNIQGDEPLITGALLDYLIQPFRQDGSTEMTTLAHNLDLKDLPSLNVAKIVLNEKDEAIYFSRHPIPYTRADAQRFPGACLKHIGLYGYKKAFLKKFCAHPVTVLEQCESLEQLRALYMGSKIKVVRVNHEAWGVDTPDDVKKIEEVLQARQRNGKK